MPAHSSIETHDSLHQSVTGLIAAAGPKFQSDIRAAMTVRPRINPRIEFQLNKQAGLPPDTIDADGVVSVKQPADIHLAWKIRGMQMADRVSLDPTWQYANGLQQLTADGQMIGHAHLHVCLLSEWPQAVIATGDDDVPMPSSYRNFGGHDWYRVTGNPAVPGEIVVTALRQISFIPSRLYMVRIDLMHIDDGVPLPRRHLEPAFSLATIMRTVAAPVGP